MEVARAGAMGPERILPNPEEDALQDRPSDTAEPEEWSGEDMEDEEGAAGDEDEASAGYYYQPLNQDPDGMNGSHTEPADEGTAAEQLQDVQDRIEVCVSLVYPLITLINELLVIMTISAGHGSFPAPAASS